MSAEPCEVHEMSWCGICNGDLKRQERREQNLLAPAGRWYESTYPGACRNCHQPFEAGVMIAYSDEVGGWIAECCKSP